MFAGQFYPVGKAGDTPADFEWGKDQDEKMGMVMLAYPDCFIKNEPRPLFRSDFITFKRQIT